MDSETHNPIAFATQLGAKLATRSRHACLLLGAGASRACGLPDVSELETAIHGSLKDADRKAFESLSADRNLEQVLSRLRRISSLLEGNQQLEGLTKDSAAHLDRLICKAVVDNLTGAEVDLTPMRGLASWAAGAEYRRAVEIFSVNYDLLVETALEQTRALWFDGFVGALNAPFRIDLVEGFEEATARMPAAFTRVWKLHGSLNWGWSESARAIVRRGIPKGEKDVAAIYPADTKYEESRRVPFVVLMDRFRRALHEPETLLLISGYSFGDEHLNEQIFDAATHRPRSEFLAFCYSDIPEPLVTQALSTPSLTVVGASEAIIGGVQAPWQSDDEAKGVWEGGKFKLGDFASLSGYLARSGGIEDPSDE